MQIEKISEEVQYKISDGEYCIYPVVTDGKLLYINNKPGKLDVEFSFVDSKPEVVAAVGRMLIAASELVKC